MSTLERNLKTNNGGIFPNHLCYLYSIHSIENTQAQQKKNLVPKMCPFPPMRTFTYPSSQATLHQWCWNSSLTTLAQCDMHFHQIAITPTTRNPLHHQTQISSIIPMKSKTSKTHNLQANKTTKCKK